MKKLLHSLCCCTFGLLAGCAGPASSTSGSGSPSPAPTQNVSGNWVFQATSSAGPEVFTQAAAALSQAQGNTLVTASLVNQTKVPGPCLGTSALVPLLGTQQGTGLGLQSFVVDGQYIDIAASLSDNGTNLSGTYAVHGGCADGASGKISALQLQPLTGTFAGQTSSAAPVTLSLSITQLTSATGDGRFLVSGTAAIAGLGCFAKGALNFPDGYVLGEELTATLHTDDPTGATLALAGTFASDASSITINSAQISGGACAGSLGDLSLKRVAS